MVSSDDLYGWFSNLYEEDNNETVKLKSVFDIYKCSEYYNSLSKQDKQNLNYKKFTAMINDNFHLKKYFTTNSDGAYILNGWQLKKKECDIEDSGK